jgi:hypothetical protein
MDIHPHYWCAQALKLHAPKWKLTISLFTNENINNGIVVFASGDTGGKGDV